jgi:hemoglobin-like flavoprotein
MTPEQADQIRNSFDAMWSMSRDIGELCYSRFFELSPEARDLFPGDIERQRIKLMNMIAELVGSLDQPAMFQSLVTHSGRQHARFGVQPSEYDAVGEQLMWNVSGVGARYPGAAAILEGALRRGAGRDAACGLAGLDYHAGFAGRGLV